LAAASIILQFGEFVSQTRREKKYFFQSWKMGMALNSRAVPRGGMKMLEPHSNVERGHEVTMDS
jgi:hypothetical protein